MLISDVTSSVLLINQIDYDFHHHVFLFCLAFCDHQCEGNKRIAATLFLWFLNNNGILYRKDGSKRLADNTLVALTLMIAESKTEEKDVMVKVVVNLINQKN